MRALAIVAALVLATGCLPAESGDGGAQPGPESVSEGGAAGGGGEGEGGSAGDVAACRDPALPTCLELQAEQGDGFWCGVDPRNGHGVNIEVETADWSRCDWCYVAMCDPNCCAYWLPVECPAAR